MCLPRSMIRVLSQNDHLHLNTVQQSFTTQSFYLDNTVIWPDTVPEWPPLPKHSVTVVYNTVILPWQHSHLTWHCPRMTTFTWTQSKSHLQHSHWTWHCPRMTTFTWTQSFTTQSLDLTLSQNDTMIVWTWKLGQGMVISKFCTDSSD